MLGGRATTDYVLIDYENVQPADVVALEAEHFRVFLFVGASQTRIDVDVAAVLQRMGERAEYIRITGNGKNALDFHIAYYIGQLSAGNPDAHFHIVSKDTGFDPLLEHLGKKKISASRVASISVIPGAKVATPKSAPDRASKVIADLVRRGAARPRTIKTLRSTINAQFQKTLSGPEIDEIVAKLTKQGVVVVNETKITYVLPQ